MRNTIGRFLVVVFVVVSCVIVDILYNKKPLTLCVNLQKKLGEFAVIDLNI